MADPTNSHLSSTASDQTALPVIPGNDSDISSKPSNPSAVPISPRTDSKLFSNFSSQADVPIIPGNETPPGTDEGEFHVDASPSETSTPSKSKRDAAEGIVSASTPAGSAKLARLEVKLSAALKQYKDFPSKGVLFEDIMPIFASPELHGNLIHALQLKVYAFMAKLQMDSKAIDVIVGLESRGFLFAPTLAYKIGAAFVPVRKKGKLPGPCETESFQKEYGADHFEMQEGAIQPGQNVIILDDIIATGGSAAAAGKLVRKMRGNLLAYLFLMELDFLKGKEKLDAPVLKLFSGQENALEG